MATVVTVTVKPSGGDYTSLAAAEAGEQRDLVSADEQLDIECYAMEDTAAVTFDGWTTDATRYIRVVVPSSERHSGKWDTSAYRLAVNAGYSRVVYVLEEFVRFEGVQVMNTADRSFNTKGIGISIAGAGDIQLDGCIIRAGTTGTPGSSCYGLFLPSVGTGTTLRVRNSVIYDWRLGIGAGYISAFTSIFYNLTVLDCTAVGIYVEGSGYTRRWKNVLCQGNAQDYAYGGGGATNDFATCISEDTSGPTVALRSTVVTFVDEAGDDFHLASGDTAAKDAGADLSADSYWPFSTDIDGETITSWSIGADGQVAAGGPTYTLAMDSGSVAVNGTAMGLTRSAVLGLGSAATTVTGTDLGLTAGRTLPLGAGSSTVTGQALGLVAARVLGVAPGAAVVTGTDLALLAGRVLGLGSGATAVTGADAGLVASRRNGLEAGSMGVTGADLSLLARRSVTLGAGGVSLAATGLGLLYGRRLGLGSGAWAITGTDLTLTYSSGYALGLDPGAIEVTGADLGVVASRLLSLGSGAWAGTGADLEMYRGFALTLGSGVAGVTGSELGLLLGRQIVLGPGGWLVVGSELGLISKVALVIPLSNVRAAEARHWMSPAISRNHMTAAERRAWLGRPEE